MTWRSTAGRLLLWGLPVALLIAAILWREQWEDRRQLAEAHALLLQGDTHEAAELLRRLARSRWVAGEAQAPYLMAQALTGGTFESTVPAPEAFRQAGSRLLLYRSLMLGDLAACRDLAGLLELAGDPDGTLFGAAVLIEEAKPLEAARILHQLPPEARSNWLGLRLEETLALLSLDTLIVVEDRRGHQVGRITRDRRFEPARGEYRNLLPVSAIQELCSEETSRSVRLTLDLELSRRVAASLKPYRGSVVVMDSRNGEILAAVSDPRTLRREPNAPFEQMREPASIAKLITTSAGLRHGIDVDDAISRMRCRGAERYGGHFLYCAYSAGKLSGLDEAMAVSCNIAFANVGRDLGWQAMVDEYRRFGFERSAQGGLGFGKLLQTAGGLRPLADLSIGLECSEITPVHAAQLAAVFANSGLAPEPSLVLARDGILRLSLRPAPPEPLTPLLDPEHAEVIVRSMLAVTRPGGTASNLAPPSFPVAMKTGTGATPGLGYHTNYIGYGPVDAPLYSFAVRITGISTSKGVRQATTDATRRLLAVLARQNPPAQLESLPAITLTSNRIERKPQTVAAVASPATPGTFSGDLSTAGEAAD